MPALYVIGRILFAALFLVSGINKFLDLQSAAQAIGAHFAVPAQLTEYTSQIETFTGMPITQVIAILGGAIEILGALAIATNLGARTFALLLALLHERADAEGVGTDLAAGAVVMARLNAHSLGLGDRASFVRCDLSSALEGPFDLIVANILARPLMRLAPEMAWHLAPGGSLILSGILDRQRRAVLAAYSSQRFRHLATLHREGWVTLHMERH